MSNPYDFDISDELSAGSSEGNDYSFGNRRYDAKPKLYNASASHARASSPTSDDTSDDSYITSNKSRNGGAASKAKSAGSLASKASNNAQSLEERVAARLAGLRNERAAAASSAAGSTVSMPASADVSAISAKSNMSGAFQIESADDTAVSGITAASRARNLGSTAPARSAPASANVSGIGSVGGGSLKSAGRGGRAAAGFGSPLSPGELDDSSSVDLSSGDFQVGAVAAKALAARRAASINDGGNSMSSSVASALGSLYGASVASGAGNMSGGSFGGGGGRNYNGSVPASANVTSATVPEASARSEESDSSNNYSDESAEIRGGYGRTHGSYAGAAGAGRPGLPSAAMSASASFRVGAGEAGGRGSAPPSANNSFTAGSARAGAAGGADASRSTGSYYGDDGGGDGDEHGDHTDESHGDSFDDGHDEASGSAGDHSNANSTADSRQGNAPGAVGVWSVSTSKAGGAAAAAGGGDGAARPSLNMSTISGGAGAGTGTGLNSGTGSRAGSATTSPTRAAPASSMTPGGGGGSAGSNGNKRDSSTMTFAELAMMMREQALLAKQTVEQHKSSALSSAAATPVASTPPAVASASTPTFPATASCTSGIITSAPAAGVPQSSAHASGASTPILNGAASTASTPTAAASAAYGSNGFNGLFTTGSSASSVAAGAAARGASTGVLPTVTVIDHGTATAISSAAASGQQSLNASYASTVDGGLPPPPPPQGTPPRYSSAYHQPQPLLGGYPGVMMMPHEQQQQMQQMQQMQMAQFMMSGAGGGSIPALNAATIANNNANLAASLRATAASALSKQLKSASIAQQQQGRRRKASTAGSSDNGVNDAEFAEDETAEEDTQAPSAILSAYVTDHEITAALGAADATAGYDEAEGADNRGLLGHSARPPRGRSLPPPPPPPGVDGGYGINDDQGSESSGWPRSRSTSLGEASARNRDARVSGVVPLQAYHIRAAVAASGFHPLPPRFSSVSSAAVRNGRAHSAHSEASSVSGASEGSNAGSHRRRPSHEVRMTKTQVLRAERAREYVTSHPDPPPPPPPPAFDPSYRTSDQLRSAIVRNGSRSGGNQRVASRTTSAQSRNRQPSGVDTAAEDRYDADRRRRRTGEESGIRFRFVSKEGEVSFGDTSRLVDDADVDLEAADGLDRTGEADEADQSAHETGIRGIGAGMSGAASRKATAAAERQRSSSTKKSSTPFELHALAYSIDRTSIMNAGPPFRLQQHQQQPVTSVGMGIGSTRGRPIGSRRNVNGSSTSNNVNESEASVGGTAAQSPNNNGGLRPSPLDASLANALIADATAARYKAESKVNELQVALNQLELKLQKAERNETDIGGTAVSPSSAAASPRGTEARAPTAAPPLTLYPLLREAITQLTVHRPVAAAPSDDDAANGADQHQTGYSVRRFIRDHDAVKAGGKGLKRAWSPIGRDPLQAAPPSANVTTADADSSNMNAASGASAGTAVYYDEVPVASAVSAAEGDGYRSYVPLKLVASLQSELASQEKMLNAYHNDNQKLREQLKASNERLAESALPAAASNGAASSPSTQEPRPAADGHQNHQLERTVNDEGAHLAPSAGVNTVNVAPAESFLVSEIQRLQSEISLSRQRQEEMSIQIRDLKASNRDLECRAAGVDMAAVKHDSEEVLRLRKELAEFQTKHKDAVADLQKKIDWYRDNQAIIDADAATIAGQASIIRELQDKLAQMRDAAASSSSATGFVSSRAVVQSKPGFGFTSPVKSKPASPASTSPKDTASSPAGGTAPTSPRSAVAAAKSALQSLQQHLNSNSNGGSGSAAAASAPQHHASDPEHALGIANRKIKDLENSLKVAEDTLSKRYPDSIANLIREAKGSTVAHGEPAAVLQELERVKVTTEQKDDEHNRRLRSLQQQFEQLRDAHGKKEQQYEGELKTLRSRLAALGDAEAASGALGTIDLSSAEAVSSREKSLRHRILELEKELERVREFYDQKSREFRKSTGAAAGRKPTPVSAASTPPAAAPAAAAGTAAPSEAVVAVPAASSSSSSGVPGGSDDEGGIKSKKADVVASSKAKSATASAAGAGAKPPSGKTGKSAVNTSKASNASSSATSTGTRTASNSRSRSPSVGARAGGDGSRRTSIASTATGISKVGAAKPALPSVPAAPMAAAAKRSTTAAATAKSAASAAGTTAKRSRAAAASAPTARPGAGTPGKDKKPSASKAATSARSPSPSTTGRSVSPAGRAASPGPSSSPSAGAGHEPRSLPEVTDLLSQVARLEAENVRLKDSLNSVSSRPGGDGDQPLPQQPDRLTQTLASIAEGAELQLTPVTDIANAPSWASAARQNQEILLRKIDQLYTAISLLEARAEAREIELARAEHAVASARSAAEVLLRSQYEDVLRVKDNALRQAKQEVRELVAAVMDMQQQQRNGTGSQLGAGMQTSSHPSPMHWQQLQDRQPEHHSQLQPTPRSYSPSPLQQPEQQPRQAQHSPAPAVVSARRQQLMEIAGQSRALIG